MPRHASPRPAQGGAMGGGKRGRGGIEEGSLSSPGGKEGGRQKGIFHPPSAWPRPVAGWSSRRGAKRAARGVCRYRDASFTGDVRASCCRARQASCCHRPPPRAVVPSFAALDNRRGRQEEEDRFAPSLAASSAKCFPEARIHSSESVSVAWRSRWPLTLLIKKSEGALPKIKSLRPT